jgi:hypothetical protein
LKCHVVTFQSVQNCHTNLRRDDLSICSFIWFEIYVIHV